MAAKYKSDLINVLDQRGFIHQGSDLEGLDALASKERITGYVGYDATATSIHIGNLITVTMLYWLQETGHRPISLMGGGTSMVGDPSGREAERQLLWKGRKSAFGAYGRVSPAYMVMDGVIPRTRLPQVLQRVNEIVAAHGLRVGNVFHAGDGNLHPNILYDPRLPGEEARVVAAGAEIMKVCAEVGGSISGEHGIGLEKSDFMPFIFSEADLAFMQRLKSAFNPTGLCNPGKMFPTKKSCG